MAYINRQSEVIKRSVHKQRDPVARGCSGAFCRAYSMRTHYYLPFRSMNLQQWKVAMITFLDSSAGVVLMINGLTLIMHLTASDKFSMLLT